MENSDIEYDAFTAAYNRGALLRELRELEREDEEQRGKHDYDKLEETETLLYETFISHQAYYDDYKHVNYKYIDLGIIGKSRLIIEQDRSVGKGGLVWDAGFILGDHVIGKGREWQAQAPRTIVELGAGTGISGLMIASAFPNTSVHLTDLPLLQPLLEKNAKSTPNATVGVLEWGSCVTSQFDVILGADVVASIYSLDALAKSIYDLAKPNSKVYLACRDRLAGSIDQLEIRISHLFSHVERKRAESCNKNPDVWVLYATGKRSNQ